VAGVTSNPTPAYKPVVMIRSFSSATIAATAMVHVRK